MDWSSEREKLMKNIFIFGYYGFQNTGDEAILQVMVDQIKENIPYAELTVLSYKARETMEKYGIKAVSRNKYGDLVKAIKESDIVISGGGSILQDATSARSLIYYLSIIYLAKKMGKKVMFYGNGFGPITKSFNKKLVKHIINKVDIITVRDEQSKEEMKSLGIKRDIIVTADVTFAYKSIRDEQVEKILMDEEINTDKKIIGISIREWKNEEKYKEIIARAGDYLIGKGYEVVFISMQYPRDYIVSEEIASMMEYTPKMLEKIYAPKELISMMKRFHVLIGMRLHSLIFSTIAGTPVLGIEYDTKIANFLQIVNQENAGKVEDLEFEEFIHRLDMVIENHKEYKRRIDLMKDVLKEKSEMNISILKSFMEDGEK